MQIIVSLNNTPVAVAALSGHGLLTASVLSMRRNPERALAAGAEALLMPELRCRLGGLTQTESEEHGFTVLEFPVVQGDVLRFALKPEPGHSEVLQANSREVWLPKEAPRFSVRVNGQEESLIGQAGYGMVSMLLVWADRHPTRCRRKSGEVLPQHQLEVQLVSQDSNAQDVTLQHHWAGLRLAPVDVLDLALLPPGVAAEPLTTREHRH